MHNDDRTTMVYIHVLNLESKSVKSPEDKQRRRKRCVLCGNHIKLIFRENNLKPLIKYGLCEDEGSVLAGSKTQMRVYLETI